MIQIIFFVYDFRSVSERSHVKNNFCMEKNVGWTARRAPVFLCSGGYMTVSSVVILKILIANAIDTGAKCMYIHMIPIMATENKW